MFKAQIAQLRHLVAEMEYLMVLMAIEIYCLIWVLFSMKQNAFRNGCYGN